jgi:hypothetical protein
MNNIRYENSQLFIDNLKIVDVRKPFLYRTDRLNKKSSMDMIRVRPEETWTGHGRRFIVPIDSRHFCSMIIARKYQFKSQCLYNTNAGISRLIRNKVLKYCVDNPDLYVDLKNDLIKIITKICNSWDFDSIITDISWVSELNLKPTIKCNWNLINPDLHSKVDFSINHLISTYKKIPLNILPFEALDKCSLYKDTDFEKFDYKSPLILINTNSCLSGYLAKSLGRGLPVTIFKLKTSE